jgi:WD40 repeat protein
VLWKQWSRNKNFELYSTASLPAYDPSGEHLALTRAAGEGTFNLVVLEDGKPEKTILTGKELILAPSWSPDGKQIAVGVGEFSTFRDLEVGSKKPVDPVNGGAQVAILNADGSGFHLVTSGPNNNAFASFAPDGKHLVYRTQGPDGEGLRMMNLEDHSEKVLTEGYDNFPVRELLEQALDLPFERFENYQNCHLYRRSIGLRLMTDRPLCVFRHPSRRACSRLLRIEAVTDSMLGHNSSLTQLPSCP